MCLAAAGGARAAGILNAACTVGDKFIVRDYKDHPTNSGANARGHGMAAFHSGKDGSGAETEYMLLPWSLDSGKGDGGLSFWNWDDPGAWNQSNPPRLRKHLAASRIREAHSTPTTNMFGRDWRTWVFQATTGFSVYDLDSVASPRANVDYAIVGSGKGGAGSRATCSGTCATSYDAAARDYSEGAVWFLALAAPYLFVAQADNGLNIYEFTDPANPAQVTWLRRLDRSWFGHRVNQVWVLGTLMVAAAVQGNYGVTLLDISDPAGPVKKRRYNLGTTPVIRDSYAWTLNGTRLYNAMRFKSGVNPNGLAVHSLDASTFTLGAGAEVNGGCSTGAYAAVQDNAAHVGLSSCYRKIDVTGTPALLSPTHSTGITGADHDFATPFGNLAFVGNDHHTTPGSMVSCHNAAKDTVAPAVNGRVPGNGVSNVKVTAGIGVSFNDNLRQWTVDSVSLPVRRRGTTTPLDGYYSYQLNIVNFHLAGDFERGTTYEVAVTSGVKDLAGNGAVLSTGTFQTEPATSAAVIGDPEGATWRVRHDLQEGDSLYGADGSERIVGVPDVLKARTWIGRAAPVATSLAAARAPSFELLGAAEVHVCADGNGSPLSASPRGWAVSGDAVEVAGPGQGARARLACRRKGLPAGTVRLDDGGADPGDGRYVVVIGPTAPAVPARVASVVVGGR